MLLENLCIILWRIEGGITNTWIANPCIIYYIYSVIANPYTINTCEILTSYQTTPYNIYLYWCIALVFCILSSVVISLQVRSLTLDVKVWEPSVIALFQALGNTFANSVWEESLQARGSFQVNVSAARLVTCSNHFLKFIFIFLI